MTTATFYSDAHPETTSVDGYASSALGSTFNSIRNVANADAAGADSVTIDVYLQAGAILGNWDIMDRSILLFDTSSLKNYGSVTIQAARLKIYGTSKFNDFGGSIVVTGSNPISNTNVVLADYNITRFGSVDLADRISIASYNITNWNTFTLNVAGINAVNPYGITKLALRTSWDVDNVEPTWVAHKKDYAYLEAADNGSNKPTLEVDYYSASAPIASD